MLASLGRDLEIAELVLREDEATAHLLRRRAFSRVWIPAVVDDGLVHVGDTGRENLARLVR